MAENLQVHSDSVRQELVDEMMGCTTSLKAFALSLSGNASRADDLVQQTFVNALSNLHLFQPGTNMSAWLFTILRNRFRSEYRKRRREVEWDDAFENANFFSTGSANQAEDYYDLHRLLLFLACLTPEHSDALISVRYLGLSYEETAERLRCAVGTVKSRVNRARAELKKMVGGGSILVNVDISRLKTATKGFPKTHPYYPIAQVYEELYAEVHGVSDVSASKEEKSLSEKERLWQELVASGALEAEPENFHDLLKNDPG